MSFRHHSSEQVARARKMRAAGWSYRRIARALGTHNDTIMRWCDPAYEERRRADVRERNGRTPKHRQGLSGEFLLARAGMLHDAGMSYAAIAVLFEVDYGERCGADRLRHWVRHGEWRPGRGRPRERGRVAA